jgi:arylsulfatase A-like enzyme
VRRPNVLIISTDQQRWDALGANGNADIITPNLDRLAAEGVNFDHCFVQNPVCMPSRLSILAGMYPSALGVLHNGVPVREDTVILPHLMRNYGYTSGIIGKLHFLPHANRDHREPHPAYGFDHLEISDEPGPYEDAYRAWVRRVAPDQLDNVSLGLPPAAKVYREMMGWDDGVVHPPERFVREARAFRGRSDVTHAAFVADQTMEYLRQHRGEPFLCLAGFYGPHSPWVAPQEYLDLYDPERLALPTFPPELDEQRREGFFSDDELRSVRQGYYAMVTEVDHHVGRILGCLEELGLAEDTVVIFHSDHGEWLGEHLRYGKGYPSHDCVSRVPLIVRYPAGLGITPRTEHALVETVDIVPTVLQLAGLPVPGHIQGQALPSVVPGAEPRGSALTETAGAKTLRAEGLRYLIHDDGREMLFDLREDPAGYREVAGQPEYADVLADLRRETLRRLIEMERPLPRVWAY